jgi:dephospho-CoA kinase
MLTIGLVGGIASGKSAVSAALARRGAVVFDADKIGHLVLEEPAVRNELVRRWGNQILSENAKIDRSAVAARVFGDSPEAVAERRFLEETLHPRIRASILADMQQLSATAVPAVVIDAPLLIESGWNEICQAVVFVDAPRELRLERAKARGWTAEEFSRREAAQMPIEEKRRAATHVVNNAGSLPELEAEVGRFWAAVLEVKSS